VILFPLYLVAEDVIRAPLSVAIPAAERIDLPRKMYDFFTFGPKHNAGIVPVGFVAFDFAPSVGLFFFWNDPSLSGHRLNAHVEAWPTDWVAASVTERIPVGKDRAVSFRVAEIHRPDRVFYGLGSDTRQSYQSRYTQQTFEAGGTFEWRFFRQSRVEAATGVRAADLSNGSFGSDPSLQKEAATGAFAIPYGFDRGYTAVYNRLHVDLDSRRRHEGLATASSVAPGSGVRVDAYGEEGSDIRGDPGSGWIRYGGSAGAYLDLNGHGRVLSASALAAFADPLGRNPIPFPELVSLGGDAPMRGYFPGRLLGRSAAVATLHYVWPVAPWLGGSLEARKPRPRPSPSASSAARAGSAPARPRAATPRAGPPARRRAPPASRS
jgi:hypothetical protein